MPALSPFTNEPYADFSIAANRAAMESALGVVRAAHEAYGQGGVLTCTDLSVLFHHSTSRIADPKLGGQRSFAHAFRRNNRRIDSATGQIAFYGICPPLGKIHIVGIGSAAVRMPHNAYSLHATNRLDTIRKFVQFCASRTPQAVTIEIE